MSRLVDRRGVTLIELIAALALSGFALLGAVMVLDQLGDSGARIARSGVAIAVNGNAPRLLRQLLLDGYVTADSADWLRGDEHGVTFSTSCQTSSGWLAACRVTLTIDQRDDSCVVLAEYPNGEQLALRRRAGAAHFRYWDVRAADSAWTSRWPASSRLPTALGLLVGGDTAIYLVGGSRD